jgi:hypothetical protein
MSVRENDTESELYCTPDDVARYIEPRDQDKDTFDTTTNPDRDTIYDYIEAASSKMDRKTQQAWRANTVRDATFDHRGIYYWLSGHPITLEKKNVRPMNPDKGDKLEVWNGNEWEDFLTKPSYTQGRDGDYWVDGPNGILWVYERAILRPHPKFRITYRYGYDHVPADIRDAIAKHAAADIASGDFYGTTVPGNTRGENADPQSVADKWYEHFHDTAQDWRKVSFI